jgi:hypothetical protein
MRSGIIPPKPHAPTGAHGPRIASVNEDQVKIEPQRPFDCARAVSNPRFYMVKFDVLILMCATPIHSLSLRGLYYYLKLNLTSQVHLHLPFFSLFLCPLFPRRLLLYR